MRLALGVLLLCLAAKAATAQERLVGDWEGHWARAGDTMPVTLHIARDSSKGPLAATFDADRLRVSGIPFADVQVRGCCAVTMTLRGDRTTSTFTGSLRGDSLSGVFREGTTEGRFAYARAAASGPAFEEREVTIPNGAVTLAGSLLLPRSGTSLPAVVFLHGSGAEGRWASRYLATRLAGRGIAALIFDKRGIGGSSGDWRQTTLDDLASDGGAAVARLLQESRIDRRRIGIHGHSQGGTLAPLVASTSPNIAFVIASAAAGTPTDSTEIFSITNSVYPEAATAADSASALAYASELVAVAYHGRPRARLDSLVGAFRGRPWFFEPPPADNAYWSFSKVFARYRALEWWARVQLPVLLIYGADDQRVPAAESAARIAATLVRNNPDADVTVRLLPGADHTFRLRAGPGGWPRTAPDYLSSILDWLKLRR